MLYQPTKKMGKLRAFLQERQWLLKKNSQEQHQICPTHLLLDGGRVSVGDSDAGVFLNAYTNALLSGDTPCVVELRTPIFKLFFDIDAKTIDAENPFADDLLLFIHSKVKDFFAVSQDLECIVCHSSAPKYIEDEVLYKHGLHLIWPGVFTSSVVAMTFRTFLIEALHAESRGEWEPLNGYEDMIDVCVFKTNGLRMVWSAKGLTDSRVYVPRLKIVTSTATNETTISHLPDPIPKKDVRGLVHLLSIRTHGKVETPVNANHIGRLVITDSDNPNPSTSSSIYTGAAANEKQVLHFKKELDSLRLHVLPPVYRDCTFNGMYQLDKCVIVRSTSKYCHNVSRNHKSNSVYFAIVRGRGVGQRCWDTECSGFTQWWPMEEHLVERFFKEIEDGDKDKDGEGGGGAGQSDGNAIHSLLEEVVLLPSQKRRMHQSTSTLSLLSKSRVSVDKKVSKKKKK
jgi:hypothetical protein